jgi:hypothetical protein
MLFRNVSIAEALTYFFPLLKLTILDELMDPVTFEDDREEDLYYCG